MLNIIYRDCALNELWGGRIINSISIFFAPSFSYAVSTIRSTLSFLLDYSCEVLLAVGNVIEIRGLFD